MSTSGVTRVQFSGSTGGGGGGGACQYLNILYPAASNGTYFFQNYEWGDTRGAQSSAGGGGVGETPKFCENP